MPLFSLLNAIFPIGLGTVKQFNLSSCQFSFAHDKLSGQVEADWINKLLMSKGLFQLQFNGLE